MERLTRRSANGTGVYATPSGEPVKWENNRHNVLQKLADYEDLEEQGRLIKLPCKVGDTVYVIVGKNISVQKIQRATIDSEMKIEFCTKKYHTVRSSGAVWRKIKRLL